MIRINEQVVSDAMRSMLSNEFSGVKTGFKCFDLATGGLENGHLIVLGARVAMGKTTFAFSLIENICVKGGKTCIFYSAEKSSQEIIQRVIAQHGGVSSRGRRAADFEKHITKSVEDIKNARLWIDDTRVASAEELIDGWRELGKTEKIDLVIIDYLQLLESKTLDLKNILERLKELAVELDCPVLVLSQITRAVEKRKNHIPRVSDLPIAKIIDEVADEILFLLRPYYYEPEEDNDLAYIFPGKHSVFSGGGIQIGFKPEIPLFVSDLG